MPNSIHSLLYQRIQLKLKHLVFGVSLASRIYFAAFLILFSTSGAFFILAQIQIRQAVLTSEILNSRLQSLEAARKLKESVISYDNLIFRFVATKSKSDLLKTEEEKGVILICLDQLSMIHRSAVIRSRLEKLRKKLRYYFVEARDLVDAANSNKLPADASLFQAASWARNQKTMGQELSSISTEGSERMEEVLSLCDEIVTFNLAKMESAQEEINNLRRDGRRTAQIVFYLACAVVLFTSMFLAISVVGPIRILMGGVRKLESGNTDVVLPITTSTEIGDLTAAFNRMAKTIHRQQKQLMKETITDNLTGVYNQRYFLQRLDEEFDRAKRNKEPLSLMMIDLDHFKAYNDTFGHEMGNVLLKKIAGLISEKLRAVDLLFRYGGDEFAALLPNANVDEAKIIAGRLVEAIRHASLPGSSAQVDVDLTFSIGGATYPDNTDTIDDLKVKADEVLYQAKAGGRDRFVWHDAVCTPDGLKTHNS